MANKVIDQLGSSIYNIMRRFIPGIEISHQMKLQSEHLPDSFSWIPVLFKGEIALYVRDTSNQATTIADFVRLDSVSAHRSTAKALVVIDLSVSVYHHPIAEHQQIDDRVYTSAYERIISQSINRHLQAFQNPINGHGDENVSLSIFVLN
jgi:hypothetical protein